MMKRKRILIMIAPAIAMVGLVACGGGSSTTTPSRVQFEYETLSSSTEGASALAGVALRSIGGGNASGEVELVSQTGTLDHAAGEVTISDNQVTDEPFPGGLVEAAGTTIDASTYEYVRPDLRVDIHLWWGDL